MSAREEFRDRHNFDTRPATRCDSTTFIQQEARVRWQKPRNTWERLFGPKANFWKCAKCGEEFSRKPEGQCNADISAQQPNFGANVLKRGIE